jgi:hypothetical protein
LIINNEKFILHIYYLRISHRLQKKDHDSDSSTKLFGQH